MDKTISLLPFIEDKNGFLLDIPTFDQENKPSTGGSLPFLSMDQGQNYSVLITAGLKSRYSEPFKPLSLLVQRDNYPIPPDDLNPVTNSDLDKIWLKTIQFYSTDNSAFHIPGEFDDFSHILPFTPLFFCKKEKKYFHPPCPDCGGPLSLCKDDRVLKGAGLFQYSTSLKRYLSCPDCYDAKGEQFFYQFSSLADDPAFVKDRFDLIRDFNKLRSKASGNFPCLECPGHSDCYITGEKAISRIGFFSFYPFYMLFFDSAPIKAIDFMAVLSGALPEDLPNLLPESRTALVAGITQVTERFFFQGEDRFFLEIIYLKLSLLEKIIHIVNQRIDKDISSAIKLSAQSIWITPSAQGSMLPFCWDFKINIIDLICNTPKTPFTSLLPENRDLNFIICLWFYTFLVNKNQEPGKVYQAIGQLSRKKPTKNYYSEYDSLIQNFPVLALENVFWVPCAVCVPEKWKRIWLKTLSTGIKLFEENRQLKTCTSHLLKQTRDLKQEIKGELFSPPSSTFIASSSEPNFSKTDQPGSKILQTKAVSPIEKQAIAQILIRLRDKWTAPPPLDEDKDDVLETIVLSSSEDLQADGTQDQSGPAPLDSIKSDPNNEFDEMEKTILIPNAPRESGSINDFEDMEETVILSSTAPSAQKTDLFDADDLDKTLIIPRKNKGRKG